MIRGFHQLKTALTILKQPGGLSTLLFVAIPAYLGKRRLSVTQEASSNQIVKRQIQSKQLTFPKHQPADIIICIHNALDDVKKCIDSVLKNTTGDYSLILVNDGSDDETSTYLREIPQGREHIKLSESSTPSGYTVAANRGLSLATAPHVVLLNSDTVVSKNWLEKLSTCLNSSSETGICGPLSNAASWQSVPGRFNSQGDWAVNELPEGLTIDQANKILETVAAKPSYPKVPLLNGFCFAFKREALEKIGNFDEQTFPKGYGEENDFCLRATKAGFQIAICDNLYIYHAKSKSYSHAKRLVLSKTSHTALQEKHREIDFLKLIEAMRKQPRLKEIRNSFQTLQNLLVQPDLTNPKILFILPGSGGGGGVNSIVQEVEGLRMLGVDARIAVKNRNRFELFYFYKSAFNKGEVFLFYDTDEELSELASNFNIAVATIFTSVSLLEKILEDNQFIMPAYYIQDYEPFFFSPEDPRYLEALESYNRIENATLFAKTRWIADTVNERHGVDVFKVKPSLDHSIFYPEAKKRSSRKIVLSAMIRPETPRRGAGLTMNVLRQIQKEFPAQVEVLLFGCTKRQLKKHSLPTDFSFKTRGKISRKEVAAILQSSDIFLDLSTYQAFGRTGLEAMACGCVPILPRKGGVSEYAVDEVNSLIVDTTGEDKIYEKLKDLITDSKLRESLVTKALETAARYSVIGASLSELKLFTQRWADFLKELPFLNETASNPKPKPELLIVSDTTDDLLQKHLEAYFDLTSISSNDFSTIRMSHSFVLFGKGANCQKLSGLIPELMKSGVTLVALDPDFTDLVSAIITSTIDPESLSHRLLEIYYFSRHSQQVTKPLTKPERRECNYYSLLSLLKRWVAVLPR